MSYMHLLVNRRGPLAKIWLAAHWEKKLTKAHIFECNLEATVEKIISPKFAIALRTSGHLLLGVVRIFHRKTKYLLADCSEALAKMKTAFRPGLVDLPEENIEAAYQSITLPEEFHDFETTLPDLNAIDVAEHFTLNQSREEDITLKEDYESTVLLCDRIFDEEPDTLRKQSCLDGSVSAGSGIPVAGHTSVSSSGARAALLEDTYCPEQDCFGDEEAGADMIEILLRNEQSGLIDDILDAEEEGPRSHNLPETSATAEPNDADPAIPTESHLRDGTALLAEEEFVLEPLDDTAFSQRKKNQRKRKLLMDAEKELSCSAIYSQLHNCTDILATLELAPPTKKTMMWKESGGVETLLSQPAQPVFHAELQRLFAKCFKSFGCKGERNVTQMESEVEKTRKDQDTTEMLPPEEPGYLQESAHSGAESSIRDDPLVLASQISRNGAVKGSGETVVPAPKNKDSEEVRWSKRTIQLLQTLQHLHRSGVSTFSLRELCCRRTRREAAASFYILLVLRQQLVLELAQSAPFADVTATAGPKFHAR